MLFKNVHLQAIKSGTLTKAFRKWRQPSVKKGGLQKTAVGVVKIEDIRIVKEKQITDTDARDAGFDSREALLKSLRQTEEGDIYRIALSYHGEDPRVRLREQVGMANEEFQRLQGKLERLDRYAKSGSWTIEILEAIQANPRFRAADLAIRTGREKEWLKLNIRKLKNLGLTISFNPGYELSSLGRAYLDRLTSLRKS